MAAIDSHPTNPDADETRENDDSPWGGTWPPRVVWLVVSAAFLSYLAFGSIEARIWSYGRLYFQDRRIVHVWAYFGDRLPDLPGAPITSVLYYASLAVMVAGTILGLWFFLNDPDDANSSQETSAVIPSTSPGQTARRG